MYNTKMKISLALNVEMTREKYEELMHIHSLSYVPFENLDYLFGLSRRQFALGEVKRPEEVGPIITIGSTTSCTMVQNLELNIIMTDES